MLQALQDALPLIHHAYKFSKVSIIQLRSGSSSDTTLNWSPVTGPSNTVRAAGDTPTYAFNFQKYYSCDSLTPSNLCKHVDSNSTSCNDKWRHGAFCSGLPAICWLRMTVTLARDRDTDSAGRFRWDISPIPRACRRHRIQGVFRLKQTALNGLQGHKPSNMARHLHHNPHRPAV